MTPIVTAPNPVLSTVAKPIEKVDNAVKTLLEQMKEALLAAHDPVGVGLAAPQIGKSVRIFLAKPTHKSPILTFINPVIISKSEEEEVLSVSNSAKVEAKKPKKSQGKMLEGCLSLPNIWGEVIRKRDIKVSYMDESGKTHTRNFRGFMAIVIQHEIDHLDGILFPKRVLEQKGTLYQSHKDEDNEDVFEELKI